MYQSITINLLNLILSLSDALDLASASLTQHQMRTAFIAWEMGKAIKMPAPDLEQLFIAALFHDVGALSPEEKISIRRPEVEDPEPHSILTERFLKQVPLFAEPAAIARFHHKTWEEWGAPLTDPTVLRSQILYLSDELERNIERSRYILHQDEELVALISTLGGREIAPELAEAFKSIAGCEEFWLDLVSPRLYSILLHSAPCRNIEIDLSNLLSISEMFRRLIDFRSPFTAAHTAGVATSAAEIARLFELTEIEIELMEVAGNLHDLGKMAVPNAILNKPGKLTKEEFAIMRQHTYYTYAILNTIGDIQQIAEWAAFHHEKLDGSGYPFHLVASQLNIGARIMAVADIFTALAEERPYRKGLNQGEVLSILQTMGEKNHLDKNVIRVLAENYDEIVMQVMGKQARAHEKYEREFAPYTLVSTPMGLIAG
jgi:HD-GYP domain-containing protein (c-di-GMP phosphodiesterase class II)